MIGILADSHDNLIALRRAVTLFNGEKCSLVIHAGDFVAPFAARELRDLDCPVKGVFGNCDGEKPGLARVFQEMGEIVEAPLVFEHNDLRFLVSHLPVPVEDSLKKMRKTRGGPNPMCDVLVFGHTHTAEVRKEGGVTVVNPGETGGWLSGRSTVALLDTRMIRKAGSYSRSIDVKIITI